MRRRLPAAIVVVAVIGFAVLVVPLAALVARVPWPELPALLASQPVLEALWLSLATAAASTAICLVLGIPMAALLAEADSWPAVPRRLLRTAVTIPLVLPPVIGGIALLMLFGRRGILGPALGAFGVSLPFTTPAVVVAQTFVALPFLVFAVEGALRSTDRRFEAAAATLGAGRVRTFVAVTLPAVAPAVAAGAVLCFTRALGEFGATITFAGSLPGVTRTLPIASYLALQSDPADALALAVIILAVSIAVLLLLRDRWLPGVVAR
ncbi:ABC transporter permease [Protaetiibacter mangrovi]|uniref:Molybdenum transport system permease n=1 Tax=Protaetiibacter mangrovi TaxID=2970926 RepID=A0ABT1ZED8_9MICO|nr:ABC transporter permease [Protaetiibacter mangrovi]MCS0499068.1 ABC transporter permease [Protaetiibacter mangrovi]TPW94603.1 molybdate ABC transporter permease subunit [Schumannella luteola]